MKQVKWQLFLTSFLILFLELGLIRFIPAYVRYLGYFTNFILLGAFLGIGAGCLLSKNKTDVFPFFAPLFMLLILSVKFFKFEVVINTNQVVYFKSNSENSLIESFILLPSVFLGIALVFTTLAQKLGRLLTKLPPLTAYAIDIFGSIAGISFFTLNSFLKTAPVIWFGIAGMIYLVLLNKSKLIKTVAAVLLVIALAIIVRLDEPGTIWSPYYKIFPYSVSNPKRIAGLADDHWRLYVNNISHQEMTDYSNVAPFYKLIYEKFPPKNFQKILIIGAGSGQDVNVAVHEQVKDITAVEIDPVIAGLGKRLHPDNPYGDPGVKLVINDARAFLENSRENYDLIIFALPDSAVLATSMSNLRLESYLFTQESFNQVKKHLQPNGIFVLYNYYRTDWIIDKIALMLKNTFNRTPFVANYDDHLAVFIAGPNISSLNLNGELKPWSTRESLSAASDNWPFLYLKNNVLPNIYIKSLLIITAIAVILVAAVSHGKIFQNSFAGDFFFLGAAFMLIETKSIVNFNLLFGSTWLVNSLVFIGMLLAVLLAIWINQKWRVRIFPAVILLLAALIINYALPLDKFLLPNFWIRYGLATLIFFSPVLLANIIFSTLFKKIKGAADNFGANLLGAFFGGMCEYLSLILGYHNLILLAVIFYILAFRFILRRVKTQQI